MKIRIKFFTGMMTAAVLFTAGLSGAIAGEPGAVLAAGVGGFGDLSNTEITPRDRKALHFIENAHDQLDDWSFRFLARLQNGEGPRSRDPILDGRADMQVEKIADAYTRYTDSRQLKKAMKALAKAHERRLRALQAMAVSDVNSESFEQLNAPIQELVQNLRDWQAQSPSPEKGKNRPVFSGQSQSQDR